VIVGVLTLLRALADIAWLTPLFARLGVTLEPSLSMALSVVATVAVLGGVARFLRDAVGDVQQFVTYEETNELHERRGRILEAAQQTLRHVLADGDCVRVVVFGHSLGSAVALDAILALRAINECAAPREPDATHMARPIQLHKIEHLITCGSPVDKIAFFFSTLSSSIRGFERMYEGLRGDIGNVPFSRSGGGPHIHWTNFWDLGDPISGAIETVMPAESRTQRVDNVRVASLCWPDPAASHDAYFEEPSLIEYVYDVAFARKWSFASPPRTAPDPGHTKGRPIYEWRGPGQAWRLQAMAVWLMPAFLVVLIWTAIGVLAPGVTAPSVSHMGLFAGLLLVGAAIQRTLRTYLGKRTGLGSMARAHKGPLVRTQGESDD
jgi:hypothetical protein